MTPVRGMRALVCVLSIFSWTATASAAEEGTIFRIGTGGAGGTYFPVGDLIAQAIRNPPEGRACSDGGGCGVPGLIAVAQTSNGSVSNIKDIAAGRLESGFAQSDTVYWAYTGTGVFDGAAPITTLRAIANLYPESIHIVARRGAAIHSIRDLAGKRVSLDEPGSGTLIDARIILNAYGLSEADLKPEYIKPDVAAEKIRAETLDAFFIVAGFPTTTVATLAADDKIDLIPVEEPERTALMRGFRFFSGTAIPADAYPGLDETPTLSVGAQWIVDAGIDADLVHAITRALWNDSSRKLLDEGHPRAAGIARENALDGIAIPLHAGAERYYKETGVLE